MPKTKKQATVALYLRVAPDLHEALKDEALRRHIPLNRLCIEALTKTSPNGKDTHAARKDSVPSDMRRGA